MKLTFATRLAAPSSSNVRAEPQAKHQSLEAAGASGVGAAGADVGADAAAGAWADLGGAVCFLAAATVDAGAAGADFCAGGAADAFADGAGGRDPDANGGSGVMMLTGGVEAAVGNSALVGLPVGTPGINAATGAAAATGGKFQIAE